MTTHLKLTINLIQNTILSPNEFFKKKFSDEVRLNILVLFGIGFLVTFIKSFYIKKNLFNYYSDETLNSFFSFLAIPQIKWLSVYFFFFIFLLLLRLFCRIYTKGCNMKDIIFNFLAIGCLCIFLQVFFFILSFLMSKQALFLSSYIALIWIIYLSVIAIKWSQKISGLKATLVYISSALPIFLLVGFAGLAPNLIWLHLW